MAFKFLTPIIKKRYKSDKTNSSDKSKKQLRNRIMIFSCACSEMESIVECFWVVI